MACWQFEEADLDGLMAGTSPRLQHTLKAQFARRKKGEISRWPQRDGKSCSPRKALVLVIQTYTRIGVTQEEAMEPESASRR